MPRALPPGPLGGLWAPMRALCFLIRRPRLWWLAAAPFAINLGLFVLFFWFSYTRFDSWVRSLLPLGGGWWWEALFYLLLVLVVLLMLAVEVYLFAVVGRIIAAPFLEVLTLRVERERLGTEAPPGPGLWEGTLRAVVQELKKLVLLLGLMAVLFTLNLIPGLGSLLFSLLAWLLTCLFLAAEFLDWPLERRRLTLGEKLAFVLRLRLTGLAFGAAVLVLGVVPVLNLALLPLAAVGGTLLFLEREVREPGQVIA